MAQILGDSASSADDHSRDAEVIDHLRHRDRRQLLYQVEEIVVARSYLQRGIVVSPGDVVFDVGANVGVAAAFFAVTCDAVVYCFEPVKPIYEDLLATIELLPTCRAFNVAISSWSGSTTITYYPESDAMSGLYADPAIDEAFARTCMANMGIPAEDIESSLAGRYRAERLSCEVRTLSSVIDELAIERIALLKIDVERAEVDVLDGIGKDHWERIDQVVAEVHDLGRFTDRLGNRGFDVEVTEEPAMRGTGLHLVYARR